MQRTIAIRHLAELLGLEVWEVRARLAATIPSGATEVASDVAESAFALPLPLVTNDAAAIFPVGCRIRGRIVAVRHSGLVLDLSGKDRGLLGMHPPKGIGGLFDRLVVGDDLDVVVAAGRVFGYQRLVGVESAASGAADSRRTTDSIEEAWRARESEAAWEQRETEAAAWIAHVSRRSGDAAWVVHTSLRNDDGSSPVSLPPHLRDSPSERQKYHPAIPMAFSSRPQPESMLPLDAFLDPGVDAGPALSRTSMVRDAQAKVRHAQCFGSARKPRHIPTPYTCGEPLCLYRASCEALHASDPLAGTRLREESIEVLSSVLLLARTIEAQTGTPFQEGIGALARNWQNDTPQVAVLGAFSSGKSTLINRLLGEDLLPSARTPTTAVLTNITHGPKRVARLEHRDAIELRLLGEGGRKPDADSIAALSAWLRRPDDYAVASVEAVQSDGAARVLAPAQALMFVEHLRRDVPTSEPLRSDGLLVALRIFGGVNDAAPHSAADPVLLRVRFRQRKPEILHLSEPVDRARLGASLTSPTDAFRLRRIVCELPLPLLLGLRLLDTAGLCSPVGFHTEVTAELLDRPPDKVVVLLDVRRLESPTNIAALHALKRFVSEPEDYRRVTFGLTFWDWSLRNYMVEDAPEPLDFDDPRARREAAEAFGAERRRRVRQLVEQVTQVASLVEPSIFLLGLGTDAADDFVEQRLWFERHLGEACAGWVGVRMWAVRWKTVLSSVRQLETLRGEAEAAAEQALRQTAAGDQDLAQEVGALSSQWRNLETAIKLQRRRLPEIVEAEREKLRLEIAGGVSKDAILKLINGYYDTLLLDALDNIEKASRNAKERMEVLSAYAREIKPIKLDRKLMGLSGAVGSEARDHISGIGYTVGAVWDFFLGAVYEMTEGNRAAARGTLLGALGSTFTLVSNAVDQWNMQVDQVLASARGAHEQTLRDLQLKHKDTHRYEFVLRQRLATLQALKREVGEVVTRSENLANRVERANVRLRMGAEQDARVLAFFMNKTVEFRRGREGDEWVLFLFPSDELLAVSLNAGGVSLVWYPTRVRGPAVELTDDSMAVVPAQVPDGTHRFELHLANLRGRFVRRTPARG